MVISLSFTPIIRFFFLMNLYPRFLHLLDFHLPPPKTQTSPITCRKLSPFLSTRFPHLEVFPSCWTVMVANFKALHLAAIPLSWEWNIVHINFKARSPEISLTWNHCCDLSPLSIFIT